MKPSSEIRTSPIFCCPGLNDTSCLNAVWLISKRNCIIDKKWLLFSCAAQLCTDFFGGQVLFGGGRGLWFP